MHGNTAGLYGNTTRILLRLEMVVVIIALSVLSVWLVLFMIGLWKENEELKQVNQPVSLPPEKKEIEWWQGWSGMSTSSNEKMIHNPKDVYPVSTLETRRTEALLRYQSGEVPEFSKSITGLATFGYGELDKYGFWQYPLAYADLSDHDRAMADTVNGSYYDTIWHAGSKITSNQ